MFEANANVELESSFRKSFAGWLHFYFFVCLFVLIFVVAIVVIVVIKFLFNTFRFGSVLVSFSLLLNNSISMINNKDYRPDPR
jgi:hypothetical protein